MKQSVRDKAIVKLAFYGPAPVAGSPYFFPPPPTVGQMMYNIGSQAQIAGQERRKFLNDIVNTGIDVNAPAKSLLGAGIGAFTGKIVAKSLGLSPFMQGVATTIGANYGYNR